MTSIEAQMYFETDKCQSVILKLRRLMIKHTHTTTQKPEGKPRRGTMRILKSANMSESKTNQTKT